MNARDRDDARERARNRARDDARERRAAREVELRHQATRARIDDALRAREQAVVARWRARGREDGP